MDCHAMRFSYMIDAPVPVERQKSPYDNEKQICKTTAISLFYVALLCICKGKDYLQENLTGGIGGTAPKTLHISQGQTSQL